VQAQAQARQQAAAAVAAQQAQAQQVRTAGHALYQLRSTACCINAAAGLCCSMLDNHKLRGVVRAGTHLLQLHAECC
jgi:hypothetical protein